MSNSLVDIYAKCGSIQDAWNIFSRMPTHDAVSRSVIIRGYVKCGQGQQALELSKEMQCDGVEVVPVTFVAMLKCKFMSA